MTLAATKRTAGRIRLAPGPSSAEGLLRFTTAGSVDDGKSTLIGRLLHDSKSVYEDQLAAVRKSRINRSGGPIDFSLLTDGLRAEREQGITIDVAYRYFETPRRKFIIADTPGHEQYTRNMATGASTANLAVISDRRYARRAGADAAACLHRFAAGNSECRSRRSTRWIWSNIAKMSSSGCYEDFLSSREQLESFERRGHSDQRARRR